MKKRKDHVVLITGAASGLGLALASRFAEAGARLHLVDINELGLSRAKTQLSALGASFETYSLDCGSESDVEWLARHLRSIGESVDVLVNHVSLLSAGSVETLSVEDWQWSIDTNLWGVIHPIRAFVPGMVARGDGHVVNVASMLGLVGLPLLSPYVASKFAVVGLSESLNAELYSYGVRVSTVCPGIVKTPVWPQARLRLPSNRLELLEGIYRRFAASPERTAVRVVEAVLRGKSQVITAREMELLWLVKRLSPQLYQQLSKMLSGFLMRAADPPSFSRQRARRGR